MQHLSVTMILRTGREAGPIIDITLRVCTVTLIRCVKAKQLCEADGRNDANGRDPRSSSPYNRNARISMLRNPSVAGPTISIAPASEQVTARLG